MKILSLDFYHFLNSKVLIVLLFLNFTLLGQSNFSLPTGVENDKIKFELADNLIIIPVYVNGVEQSFILDTGANHTIVFDRENESLLENNKPSLVYFKGLGDGESVPAIKSEGNSIEIGQAFSKNHVLYQIPNKYTSISSRVGSKIDGIIGYDLFKEFAIEVNYTNRFIKLNTSDIYLEKVSHKYDIAKLHFVNKKKPLISAKYETKNGWVDVNLLLDLGSSSTFWLYPNQRKNVEIPDRSFEDFLGSGLNNNIYGQKGKVKKLHIANFVINEIITSFPFEDHIKGIPLEERQGSIGGDLLKRFDLIIDYSNEKVFFRKNKYFSLPFSYDMSGISLRCTKINEVIYKYEREDIRDQILVGKGAAVGHSYFEGYLYEEVRLNDKKYEYEYEVGRVRPGSPADLVGIIEGDFLVKVNDKYAKDLTISELNKLLSSKDGKKIKMQIQRQGVQMTIVFQLKEMF